MPFMFSSIYSYNAPAQKKMHHLGSEIIICLHFFSCLSGDLMKQKLGVVVDRASDSA